MVDWSEGTVTDGCGSGDVLVYGAVGECSDLRTYRLRRQRVWGYTEEHWRCQGSSHEWPHDFIVGVVRHLCHSSLVVWSLECDGAIGIVRIVINQFSLNILDTLDGIVTIVPQFPPRFTMYSIPKHITFNSVTTERMHLQ